MTPSPDSSYREIPLTQGQVALVSAHRYEELMKYQWHAYWSPDTKSFYASRHLRKGSPTGRGSLAMARHIMGLKKGDKRTVDHFNHVTLDNRDGNLRLAAKRQQTINQRLRSDNTSGYKGVYRDGKKWIASIRINGKAKKLGRFVTPQQAYAVYVDAAVAAFGEFVCLPKISPQSVDPQAPAYS